MLPWLDDGFASGWTAEALVVVARAVLVLLSTGDGHDDWSSKLLLGEFPPRISRG